MRNPSWGPRNKQRPHFLQLFTNWISFPATQVSSSDANTLDDYEEGTWTPTDASGASLSLTASGTYTKVGRMVFARYSVTYPATASGASAKLDGLPFTISTGATTGTCLGNSSDTGGATVCKGLAGSTQISIFAPKSAAITNANLSAAIIQGSFIYETS